MKLSSSNQHIQSLTNIYLVNFIKYVNLSISIQIPNRYLRVY